MLPVKPRGDMSDLSVKNLSTAEIVKELEVQRCLDFEAVVKLEAELDIRCGNLFAEPELSALEMLVGKVTVP